jgi:hypothetical protein
MAENRYPLISSLGMTEVIDKDDSRQKQSQEIFFMLDS